MVESEIPKKKKVQEQIDAQVTRELEEQTVREDQRMSEQIARDTEIARIHAEEELQIMIDGLHRSSYRRPEKLLEDHKAGRQLSQLLIFCGLIKAYGQGGFEPVMGLSEGVSQHQVTHKRQRDGDLVEGKLYDICGLQQVTSKDKEIFMLMEKDYPLRKGLEIVMICYKLQVENYSQMENDLILKIYKIANCPSQQVIEFPLPEEVPTASEESSHCQ
nr:hypothetical protein [Tanacetum cinerariifolium]